MSKRALQYVVFYIPGTILLCTSLLMISSIEPIVGEMAPVTYLDLLFRERPLAIMLFVVGLLWLIGAKISHRHIPHPE